jgi:hypothetical protein
MLHKKTQQALNRKNRSFFSQIISMAQQNREPDIDERACSTTAISPGTSTSMEFNAVSMTFIL